MKQHINDIEADFDAVVAARLEGRAAFLVCDVDDIGTGRAPVCPYEIGELLEACDHADLRGGFVVNAAGRVVYVSPKADLSQVSGRTLNVKAFALFCDVRDWIRENRKNG